MAYLKTNEEIPITFARSSDDPICQIAEALQNCSQEAKDALANALKDVTDLKPATTFSHTKS